MLKEGDDFRFPIVGGSVKLARKGSEVRPSNQIRQDIEEGDEHRSDPQGETDDPDSAYQQRGQDELEAKRDFWIISASFIHRHRVQERQKLNVPQESSFPIPLKYIETLRRTHNIGRSARIVRF